jgi:hypothetical protein
LLDSAPTPADKERFWGFEICSKLRQERRHDDIVRAFRVVSRPSDVFRRKSIRAAIRADANLMC